LFVGEKTMLTREGMQRICSIMKRALREFPEVEEFEWEYCVII